MPKVFIIEPPRNNIDVSKAQEYGEIIYIFGCDDRRCSAWDHARFGQTVLRRLKELNYDPKVDFICIVGAMLIMVNSIIAIAQKHSTFTLLLFNSVENAYVSKVFKRSL